MRRGGTVRGVLTPRRLRWLAMAAGITVVTVTVPPLIFPRGHHRAAPGRTAGTTPVGAATVPDSPSATVIPGPAVVPSATALACAEPAAGAVDAGRPSCRAYHVMLGNGWRTTALATKLVAGDRVPGGARLALRVEPQQRTASVTFVPAVPLLAHGRLTASVYGGRTRGTSLRVSAGTTASVVLTAPPDQWTSVSVDPAALLPGPVQRRLDVA